MRERLTDLHDSRIRLMDAHGIKVMILSLNAPAVQRFHKPKEAYDIARRANDFLADTIRKQPNRFQALAALPMQEPETAAREFERFSQAEKDPETPLFYDLPQYWPFWELVDNSMCRSTCIRAVPCRVRRKSTKATTGYWDRHGRLRRRRPFMLFG